MFPILGQDQSLLKKTSYIISRQINSNHLDRLNVNFVGKIQPVSQLC